MQPDVVIYGQFFAALHQQKPKGELRLLIAVLENAVDCFQKYFLSRDIEKRRLHKEAALWIMEDGSWDSSAGKTPGLSFSYVCEALGIDPSYLRHGLDQWRRRQLKKN